ncbi:MarR family winged helix-turn-helix transcriptional regulator [Jhaorihella thermophila]|uniref:DNA-binding transcriptional regulator, MarR family n=1 Tax=Jhaorihella thermophila TaxID=488547 RepID=A0A1H5W2C1_9RHOB|nr:MarR family transcriptional regulator [Jhaorihella thermophila]SEF93271.1 DNA-binding transcriptional regulator, MarR family [Jhaorihella thermophila]
MPRSFRVFHLLQVAHSALFRAADKRSRRMAGLTTTQIAILLILRKSDGLPISALAAQLAMGKSSLTGLIDRLADKRLVERRPCPRDARVTLIRLTEAGRAAAATALPDTRRHNAALLEPFSDDERAVIRRFLQHLTDNAETIINGPDDEDSAHD